MRSVPGAVATGFFYASTDSMTAKKDPVATAPGTDLIATVIQSRVRMLRQFPKIYQE
jgi:hypothetical protein